MSDPIIVPVMIGPPSHRGELMLPAMRGQRVSRRPGDRATGAGLSPRGYVEHEGWHGCIGG